MAGWKKDLMVYGTVRAKSLATLAEDYVPPEEKKKQGMRGRGKDAGIAGYLKKEQADICLSCTKETCSGSPECFARRRKELTPCETGSN